MKRSCLLILFFSVILFIGENYAAKYGNAFFKEYHALKFGLKLTYANIYIIVDQDRWGYLAENNAYSESVPFVDSILGYSVNKDEISIYIISGNKPMRLNFTSYDMVLNRTPIITEFHSFDENTIFVREEPFIAYYWRLIAFVLISAMGIMIVCIFILVFIRGFRAIFGW